MKLFPIIVALGIVGYGVAAGAKITLRPDRPDRSAPRAAASHQADFQWGGRLGEGQTIMISGVNGAVRALAGPGPEVTVTAAKRAGRRGDPEDVRIEVVEHDGGVTICALYPERRGGYGECRADGGRQRAHDNDTKVQFEVRVPAGVHFVGQTVNGNVEARGVSGNVEAHTVNGGIEVDAAGVVEATTVNGSIRASMGRSDLGRGLEFRTVNGSITVAVPEGVGATVVARTVNGAIETEFPLTVRGRFGPRRVEGEIGGGGQPLRLETVNGSIHLQRR